MAEKPVTAGDLPPDTPIFDTGDGEAATLDAEIEENESLNNLLADLGGMDNIKVHVYRCGKGNALSWVDSFAPADKDIEALMVGLRDDYGGGRFKIQIREHGTIRRSKVVEVESPPERPEFDRAGMVRELKAEQQKDSGGMTTFFAEMMRANQEQMRHQAEQQQRFMETIVNAMAANNNNQPAVDPAASMNGIIQSVAELHKLAAPVKPIDPTEMILKGVELVSAIRGDGEGGGEANIYTVLAKALGSFGDTLGTAMSMGPTPAMLAAPGTAAQQIADQSTKPAEGTEAKPAAILPVREATLPKDHALAPFEPFVDWMLQLAQKNANPELYAEVIIDQIGAEMAHAWLSTEEGLNTLQQALPKTREHASWLTAVGVEIDAFLRDVDEPGDGTQNASEIESQRTSDVHEGHDSPDAITIDQSPDDGDPERPGGHSGDPAGHVEVGEPSKDDATNT